MSIQDIRFLINIFSYVLVLLFVFSVIDSVIAGDSNESYQRKNLPPVQPNNIDNGSYDNVRNNEPHICTRECEGSEPKVCYYKGTVETYVTMGSACGACPTTQADCFNPQCVPADGYEKAILTINRQIPAPSIQVCVGDTIVYDIYNKMKGKSLTIHWHGIRQQDSQYMDGVPMVTQCPILEGETFRYIFNTTTAGTFFYHSHSALEKVDGISGSLIVRDWKSKDPNGHLFKNDFPSHLIFLMDWMHTLSDERWPGNQVNFVGQGPDSYLINGHGVFADSSLVLSSGLAPIKTYTVQSNSTYRFRIISSLCLSCQVELMVEGHSLTVISTDDRPVNPVVVNRIVMAAGERYDVVITTDQEPKCYWIWVRGIDTCSAVYQVAVLRYEDSDCEMPSVLPFLDTTAPYYLNPKNSRCNDDTLSEGICINQMTSPEKTPSVLLQQTPDYRILMVSNFHTYDTNDLFQYDKYQNFFVPGAGVVVAGMLNNKTLTLPGSPLISQKDDVPKELYCGNKCKYANASSDVCHCLHVIKLPKNAVCELILVDGSVPTTVALSHPFHIHGHYYHVMDMGILQPPYNETVAELNEKLQSGYFLHENMAMKDTIAVPSQGHVVVRIYLDNPGWWFFHCHFAYHQDSGMALVFWVGEMDDLPPVPPGFPKCGNFEPDIPNCDSDGNVY